MHVVYGQKGVVSFIIVVALICMDMYHCVVSLKEACLLVQKGGIMACPKLKRRDWSLERGEGVMGLEGGPGSWDNKMLSWYHMHNVTLYRESHYILFLMGVRLWLCWLGIKCMICYVFIYLCILYIILFLTHFA